MTSPPASGSPPPTPTRQTALRALREAFRALPLENPDRDARILLLAALGIDGTELALRPSAPLSAEDQATLAGFQARRLAREPVARILGEREFWGLPFALSPDTLVPRPDSETLVETALRLVPDRRQRLRIVDLGTGSGCLLVALLHEWPNAIGIGIDRSHGAAATARRNAIRNGVGHRSLFAVSDWGGALAGAVDLIVSNPPYIATSVIGGLDREVRDHDPLLALDGGADGLDAYRIILAEAASLLAPGGHLVLEIGYDQNESVQRLAAGTSLSVVATAADLGGNPRCIALKRT